MTTILWGHAVSTALALIGLWAIYYGAIRPLQVDILRQRLFAIRDDLFDFAADEGISFYHPAYRGLRNDINSFIRFAHKITFSRLVLTILIWEGEMPNSTWHQTIEGLSPLARNHILQTHRSALEAVVHHLVWYSPLLLVISGIVFLRTIWDQAVNQRLLRLAESFEEQARDESQVAA